MDLPLTPAPPEHVDPIEADRASITGAHATPAQRRDDRRWYQLRWVRIVGWTAVGSLIGALVFAYWALDRFVIDDVKIGDVAAFEAATRSTPSAPSAASPISPTIDARSSASSAPGSATAASAVSTNVSTTDATNVSSDATQVSDAATTTIADSGATAFSDSVTLTDTTYVDDDTRIEITKVESGSGRDALVYFVADIRLADVTQLRSGFAENKFGTNIIANTSTIASDNDALFAINGDYYGFRDKGMLIRNGVVFRPEGPRRGLAIHADGTMRIYDESTTNGEQLLDDGVWATLSFGPPLVDDGQVVDGIDQVEVDTNFGNHSVQGSHPRTGVGMIGPNHFLFVVVDGRSRNYSRGMTLPEFARLFQELGATEAYNLDGGGSSTMYFNGKLVNNPLGKMKERGTSDILYIAA